ncbi:MAG: imelysin family protein [Sulfitobacter sp.]
MTHLIKRAATAFAALAFAALPATLAAQSTSDVVENHILPRFTALAQTTAALADASQTGCAQMSAPLETAYHSAFDAWVSASHLRFGPTETDERAFALAFWPDTRGFTPKTLAQLIETKDNAVQNPDEFAHVSIAARGFYALEFMLYDETLANAGDAAYRCALINAITADMEKTAAAILADWQGPFAQTLQNPARDAHYRSDLDVQQEFFKSLSTGLQFTADTRLARPLGTFDRPRPARAEARRSDRSARHVSLSLSALHDLAITLAAQDETLTAEITQAFEKAQDQLAAFDDPSFASVADPQRRLKLEVVQQSITAIRALVVEKLGPKLGVTAGFNALDGD